MTTLLVTGDETGLLKAVDYEKQMVYSFGDEQSRELSIIGLSKSFDEQAIALLRQNGVLEYWKHEFENQNIEFQKVLTHKFDIEKAVDMIPVYDSSSIASHLLSYSSDGRIILLRNNPEILEKDITSNLQEFTVRAPLSAVTSGNDGAVLMAGKENDIILYNVHTQQSIWEARNVPHDKLRLRVPVWVTTLDYLHPLSANPFEQSTFLSGTAYKHVRLYDTKVSNRPVKTLDIEGDYRLTVVKSALDGMGFYVADSAGNLWFYDIRTYRRVNTLKCFQGSIRSLTLATSECSGSVIAGVGLDRCVRVYDCAKGNRLLQKIYLKNRLNRSLAFANLSLGNRLSKLKKGGKMINDSNGSESEDESSGSEDRDFEGEEDQLEDIEFDSDNNFGIDENANSDDEGNESDEESETSSNESADRNGRNNSKPIPRKKQRKN